MSEEEVKQPHPNTPKGIDWVAAKQYYLESFSRTYANVASKFDVSAQQVEKHGSEESWVKSRKGLGERALEEFESNKVAEIAQSNNRHLAVFRSLLDKAEERLAVSDDLKVSQLKNLADTIEKAVHGERLILGLPTTVSKSEIMGKLTTDLKLSSEQLSNMDKFFKDEA